MRAIGLNELPKWLHWPGRLLGLTEWRAPVRTNAKNDAEYDKDKYAKDLAHHEQHGGGPEEIMSFEWASKPTDELVFSLGDELFVGEVRELRRLYRQLIVDTLRPLVGPEMTVVELGCGFGYNLWCLSQAMPTGPLVGGEFALNAVKLAERLYAGAPVIRVRPFDFYDREYPLLGSQSGRVVIFTSHAIQVLPRADGALETLLRYADRISDVVHFEPLFETEQSDLLSLMRRRYTQVNDYNVDLLQAVRSRGDRIEVSRLDWNKVGVNPLCATSVLHWRPRR